MKLFSLSKNERIKEKKNFQALFQNGSSVFSSKNTLKALYLIKNSNEPGVKIAVGISRKAGRAVWRNRLKRLIRNAYRMNKASLVNTIKENNKQLVILFTSSGYNEQKNKKLFYNEVAEELKSILEKIERKFSDKIK